MATKEEFQVGEKVIIGAGKTVWTVLFEWRLDDRTIRKYTLTAPSAARPGRTMHRTVDAYRVSRAPKEVS